MTEKYTPEKVAELVATANAMREQLGEDYPKTGSILDLWLRTAAALTAVTAERDTVLAASNTYRQRAVQMASERDRLHKAITEALAAVGEVNEWDGHGRADQLDNTRRILRAALDKEGNDDE